MALSRTEKPKTTRGKDSLKPGSLPAHVAIIMDGNGRWARTQGLPRVEGHARGMDVVRLIVEECSRLKIEHLTLFCFSSENWKRPQPELDFLMQLLGRYLVSERKLLAEKNIRFGTLGRKDQLPAEVLGEIEETKRLCRENTGMGLSLAINYGGRGEIADAVRNIAKQVQLGKLTPEEISEEVISSSLYTAGIPDPDLLIRTAGEMRISNFLLWQVSYSEIWVTEKTWPEFGIADLQLAFQDFARRERKFGGLNS